jgi:hypothetical protein
MALTNSDSTKEKWEVKSMRRLSKTQRDNKIRPIFITIHGGDSRDGSRTRDVGFSGYNQVRVAPENQPKTCFITEWGAYATRVMSFGLMSAPSTFQRGVMTIFAEFLNDFMKEFLDDFSIYGTKADHIKHLKLCLQRCREWIKS